MKKFFVILLSFFLFLVSPTISNAQQDPGDASVPESNSAIRPIIPFPETYPENYLPLGQNHFYTVNLRGNGQVVIFLKTVFSNLEEASMSSVKLAFSKEPKNISVFQAYRSPRCLDLYDPRLPHILNTVDPLNTADPIGPNILPPYPYPYPCKRYEEPNYLYGWEKTTYHKAKFVLNNRDIAVELPKEIKPNGSGSLVLAFSIPDITSKGILGEYDFSFDTVKTKEAIQALQVGINVDPDFYLKDAKGEINYAAKEASLMTVPSVALDKQSGISSTQFDQFYNQIGQGIIVKTVNNLQPDESYTVNGTYADNRAKLYSHEIRMGIGIVILVLFLGFGSLFIAAKKVLGQNNTQPGKSDTHKSAPALAVFSSSFGSSLLILLYTIGLYIFNNYFGQIFQYNFYDSNFQILPILFGVISFIFYTLLLLVPGIVIGIKNGIAAGAAAIIFTIFWLILYGILIIGLLFLFFPNKQLPFYTLDNPVTIQDGVGVEGGEPPQ